MKKLANRYSSRGDASRDHWLGKCLMPQAVLAHDIVQWREVAWSRNRSGVLRPRFTLRTASRRVGKCHGPHQVVSERVPQRCRLHLVKPSHHKPHKPTPTRNGVDTLGGGGAVLVDVLGLLAAHALAPLGNGFTVIAARQVRVTARVFGLKGLTPSTNLTSEFSRTFKVRMN